MKYRRESITHISLRLWMPRVRLSMPLPKFYAKVGTSSQKMLPLMATFSISGWLGRTPHGLWCAAASELIASEFPDHSLLTMKAFPLEYEGRAPPGTNSHVGLLSR